MVTKILEKLEKRRIKRTFKEYGFEISEFHLSQDGVIQYAQWLNPLEQKKVITQSSVNFFKKFIKKGDLAIDIGAHSGDTAIPMGLAAGKEGLVLALDPNKIVYKILEQNSKLNPEKTNIVPLCAAATAEDGDFYYHSSEATFNNGGISTTRKSSHGKFSLDSTIRGVNVQKYINANLTDYVEKISFVKIDTEGLDYVVLQSISELLSQHRPVVIAECFKKASKQLRFAMVDFLNAKSYEMYHVDDFSENATFTKLSKEGMLNWKHFDFCAIPSEKLPDIDLKI
jgi:FkbM family methyltransferase